MQFGQREKLLIKFGQCLVNLFFGYLNDFKALMKENRERFIASNVLGGYTTTFAETQI